MKIVDRVYGDVDINEPVLLDLINSKPVQRLKGINQAGASQYAIEGKTVSRFEHSVGVMILLRKLGASIEEQIAGLLHDVPHTAFSHVIDFVFKEKNNNHEFHENFFEKVIMQSEIPDILKRYGIDIDRILDENNFSLLEKSLPDLCADRIDYTLRDKLANEGCEERVKSYLDYFVVMNKEIIISDKLKAKCFAEDYLSMDDNFWSSPFEIALYQILADAIKIALDENILTEEDLFGDDDEVYSKLKASNNLEVLEKLKMINPNLKIALDENDYDFYSINKLRYINPKFVDSNGVVCRVEDCFDDFSEKLKEHNLRCQKGVYVKILSY